MPTRKARKQPAYASSPAPWQRRQPPSRARAAIQQYLLENLRREDTEPRACRHPFAYRTAHLAHHVYYWAP